jgi:nitrogen-specific signal transduction histidine kinase/CheY-like chemotaxis protein
MVEALKAAREEREQWAHTLEERVRERTAELVAVQTQMAQAEKLASLGRVAAGVAHEINNPLGGVLTFASLAIEDCPRDHPLHGNLDIIVKQSLRCRDIVKGLLAFSRQSQASPSLTSPNAILDATLHLLENQALFHNIEVVRDYARELPQVFIDPDQLQQVVMNIVLNAVDAMDGKGRLTLRTAARVAEREVEIAVADSGKGIPQGVLPLIFEPFFTTKEVGKGTGLGLATVYGIVKQHGGWIELATAPGQGTTFRVYLPAVEGPRAAAAAEAAPAKLPCGSETILIVEDETSLRALIAGLLRRCGYTVFEAASGPAALAIWNQHQASIHLLLTDVMLPEGMSGVELAKRLLAEKPQLKVICASGYSPDLPGPGAALLAGLSFLQKPLSYRKLAEAIRECLDQPQDRGKFDA